MPASPSRDPTFRISGKSGSFLGDRTHPRNGAHTTRRGVEYPCTIAVIATAALFAGIVSAQALDDGKYPDWKGQWTRERTPIPGGGQTPFDPTKPVGRGQQAPLTPEYQARFEANLKDQSEGGQGNWQGANCYPVGMPGVMNLYRAMEIVITPETTYIMIDHLRGTVRRVFTDGRDWPKGLEPGFGFDGYSIGTWIDQDGDGRYDTLEIETRDLRGPRAYDPSGLPFHDDNETVVKERMYLDKVNTNILHDEMTVFDHALTRPWSVHKKYQRDPKEKRPLWVEDVCVEGQMLVRVGTERYFLSGDGYLMPVKKGQASPDTRYFEKK
jgi:hypothetical protein